MTTPTQQTSFCPACGQPRTPADRFCASCGNATAPSAASPALAPPPLAAYPPLSGARPAPVSINGTGSPSPHQGTSNSVWAVIAVCIVAAIGLAALALSSSAGSSNSSLSPAASTPPAAPISLVDTSTCADWQSASSTDNQTYADAQGGSIAGVDVSQYLTTACSSFLSGGVFDPQIGDIVSYLQTNGDTGSSPCNSDPNSSLPNC